MPDSSSLPQTRPPEPGASTTFLDHPNPGAFPWDSPRPPDSPPDPAAPRVRHDAFTEARKRAFLEALVKEGCIARACQRANVGARTV